MLTRIKLNKPWHIVIQGDMAALQLSTSMRNDRRSRLLFFALSFPPFLHLSFSPLGFSFPSKLYLHSDPAVLFTVSSRDSPLYRLFADWEMIEMKKYCLIDSVLHLHLICSGLPVDINDFSWSHCWRSNPGMVLPSILINICIKTYLAFYFFS